MSSTTDPAVATAAILKVDAARVQFLAARQVYIDALLADLSASLEVARAHVPTGIEVEVVQEMWDGGRSGTVVRATIDDQDAHFDALDALAELDQATYDRIAAHVGDSLIDALEDLARRLVFEVGLQPLDAEQAIGDVV